MAAILGSVLRRLAVAAVAAGGAAVATAGARYVGSKRFNAAERLGEALLDSQQLNVAAGYTEDESEAALAACTAYLINVAHQSAAGIAGPPAVDSVGFERKVKARKGAGQASVITTAPEPEPRWQFEMDAPGVARVSGSRRLLSSKFSGPRVNMRTPDTVSIRFENGYVASIESDLEFTSNLIQVTGPRTQVHGTANVSDNRGNVGRLRIDAGGGVTGTVTRGANIVGRFEGNLGAGITFRQYSPGAA